MCLLRQKLSQELSSSTLNGIAVGAQSVTSKMVVLHAKISDQSSRMEMNEMTESEDNSKLMYL